MARRERTDVTQLRKAAGEVMTALSRTSEAARYAFPIRGAFKTFSGYSYDLPKEEQIRSQLYRALANEQGLTCELEWNLYAPHR